MTKILLLHSQYLIMPPGKCSNTVNSVSTQTIKKFGIDPTPTNLVDCAKALVSNPPTQTKKTVPVQLHHPPVAPPPLPPVLPQNNNVFPEPTPCNQSCSTKFLPIKHRMWHTHGLSVTVRYDPPTRSPTGPASPSEATLLHTLAIRAQRQVDLNFSKGSSTASATNKMQNFAQQI